MVAEQRPAIRALLVKRLEGLWEVADEELDGGKDRVRWAELQLRIADRLARWYKLDESLPVEPGEEDAGADNERMRLSIAIQLDDLEAKAG